MILFLWSSLPQVCIKAASSLLRCFCPVDLRLSQSVPNKGMEVQQHVLSAVCSAQGSWELLQALDKAVPVGTNSCCARQAAWHGAGAAGHAGLAQHQPRAVWAVLHSQQSSAAGCGEVWVICCIDPRNPQIQSPQESPAGWERSSHLSCGLFGNAAKGPNVSSLHLEASAHSRELSVGPGLITGLETTANRVSKHPFTNSSVLTPVPNRKSPTSVTNSCTFPAASAAVFVHTLQKSVLVNSQPVWEAFQRFLQSINRSVAILKG